MMIKKVLIILFISAFIPFKMHADWIPLDNNRTYSTPPAVTILSDGNYSTIIKIDISGFDLKEFNSEMRTYQSVDLLSDVFITKPGYPELPYISKILAIPDQAGISVEVLETSKVQIFKNIQLQPARKSWFEGKPESPYKENTEAYQSTGIYPNEYASMETPSIFRDFRIARLSIFPLRYVPAKNEIHAVSSITIRINYGKGEIVNPKTTSKKEIAPSFGKLYRSLIFNYQSVLDKRYNGRETGREVMLCIMPDIFVNSFQPYAKWKRQSGTDIHITKFSDINANANNPTIIKDHIADAYHNWEHPPTYVLLVGDHGVIPVKIVDYEYSFANEDYFVEIDGDDFLPEMMIGRFTNHDDYRMKIMINNFIKYEKNPYTDNTDWFKKGLCCSNNAYESQVETKRFTAGVMIDDGGFTSVDTLMSDGNLGGLGCSMNLNDIINAINDGRSYVNYRGEGWIEGWTAKCYYFNTTDISSINNGEKLTFITSIGCGVARFYSEMGEGFGEGWLESGTIENPRGAVAFVGPSSNTHTAYNNRIDKGIYVGMFREEMDTPGQALLRGKLYMYKVFGADDPKVGLHYRVYYVLGDPSIHIWRDVPLAVNVDHPTSITVGNNTLEITITYASSGLPVPKAEVCITGEKIFAVGVSDPTGKVNIEITTETNDPLTVTVRGKDVIPYQGTINVTSVSIDENQEEGISQKSNLEQNSPNPFSTHTNINYSIPVLSNVTLKIYNLRGELVRTLQDGQQPSGKYSVVWNGLNDNGNSINSGIYIYRLQTMNFIETRKLLLLK